MGICQLVILLLKFQTFQLPVFELVSTCLMAVVLNKCAKTRPLVSNSNSSIECINDSIN